MRSLGDGPGATRPRRAVLAVRAAELATLVVTGKDRVSWLNGLVTCDLVKRAAGRRASTGSSCARNGRVLADPRWSSTTRASGRSSPCRRPWSAALRAHLDHYLVMEDAEIAPGDGRLRGRGCSTDRAPARCSRRRAAPAGVGGRPRSHRARRRGRPRAGRPRGRGRAPRGRGRRRRATVGDAQGWEALRLERGVPRFGVDFDDKTYPQEASLEKAAVSFDKGCYLGQEVVCMLEMRGHVKRKLVSLVLEAPSAPAARRAGDRRERARRSER